MAVRVLALGLAVSIGIVNPANSQSRSMPCAPLNYALEALEAHWGETPTEIDRAMNGLVTIIRTENFNTGSYSVLAVTDGTACLISEGQERRS